MKRIESLLQKPELSIDETTFIISEGYGILSELTSEYEQMTHFGTVEVESLGDMQVVYENMIEDKLIILKKWYACCKEKLGNFVSGIYLHGSMATLNYTEFSDLDVIIIPRSESIQNPDLLKELAFNCILSSRFLYKFNPLQHGGYLIISPIDLRFYNASILPPQVFGFSKVLFGSNKIDIDVKNSKIDYLASIWKMIQNIRSYAQQGFVTKNIWQLCVFVSFVLILPVSYLLILNDYVYKTFSFDRAKRYFSASEWEAVEIAQEVRNLWSYQLTLRENLLAYLLLDLQKNPILFEYLMKKYSQGISSDLCNYLNRRDFYQKALLFSETVAQVVYELGARINEEVFDNLKLPSIT